MTERTLQYADELWAAGFNTAEIATQISTPEHEVERRLHWLWNGRRADFSVRQSN